jgi:Ca2+-binding RTX toxin-like protein
MPEPRRCTLARRHFAGKFPRRDRILLTLSSAWEDTGEQVSCAKRLVAVLVGAVALAVPAGASAAVEPGGGSGFASSTDGWTSEVATCQASVGAPGEDCFATNSHDPGFGNPAGSLRTRLSLETRFSTFEGDYTWRSPSFRVPGEPGAELSGAEFGYDRRFGAGGLMTLGPEAEVEAIVVDETAGTRTELIEETLDADDNEFERRMVTAETGTLTREHTHHIELHATIRTTDTDGVITGPSDVHFDNVALAIPSPPGNSPGVTFPRPPMTGAEITAVMNSLNLDALVGGGPGGSQVASAQCTIVGTSGADRMRGTSQNDVMCGLGGNDAMSGKGGRDVIDTGDGDDRATGNKGGDLILGLGGTDNLNGKKGKDEIGGGADHDRLSGHGNADLLAARDGARDLVRGGASHHDRARVDRADRVRKVERRAR